MSDSTAPDPVRITLPDDLVDTLASVLLGQAIETHRDRPPPTELPDWGIIEQFGHKKLMGRLRYVSLGGTTFIEVSTPAIDVPAGSPMRQNYSDAQGWHRVPAHIVPATVRHVNPRSLYALKPAAEDYVRGQLLDSALHGYHNEMRPLGFVRPELEDCAPPPKADTDDSADFQW